MVGPMSEEMISGNAKRPVGSGGTGEYLIYIDIGSSFWKLNGVHFFPWSNAPQMRLVNLGGGRYMSQ